MGKAKQKELIQGVAMGEESTNKKTIKTEGKLVMHLVKSQQLKEEFSHDMTFKEANIDSENKMINGVCLFGRRESANGRTYLDKAIESIANFSNGTRCFINHISKSEMVDRSGVRDLRDWVGVFEGSNKKGDAVFANLKVREAYWDLVKDIALLKPKGIGHSIDARVKVYKDNNGKENVADVESLRSVDLVSSAATTNNLFEATLKDNIDIDPIFDLFSEGYIKYRVQDKFNDVMSTEGIIQDKIDEDQLRREIDELTWVCADMVRCTIKDKEMAIEDKKKKVMAVFDDLDTEVKKRMSKMKKNSNNKGEYDKMEFNLSDVMANKEMMEGLANHFSKQEKYKTLEADLKEAQEKVANFTKTAAEKDKAIEDNKTAITALEAKNKELAQELDKIKAAEAVAVKKNMIAEMITESKLPKELITDIFMEDLMNQTDKDQIAKRLEDRKSLVSKKVIVNSGEERRESITVNEGEKKVLTKEEKEAAVLNLGKTIRR